MPGGADDQRAEIVLRQGPEEELAHVRARPEAPELLRAEERARLGEGGPRGGVQRLELRLVEQQVDAAEGDERGLGDVEGWWEGEVREQRGGGREVEVLGPGAVEGAAGGVVGRRQDVWVKFAGEREEVVFGYGICGCGISEVYGRGTLRATELR